jgi:hypothetical protein
MDQQMQRKCLLRSALKKAIKAPKRGGIEE